MVINKEELFLNTLEAVNKRIKRYQEELDMIKESMDANDIKTDYDEDNRGKLLGDYEKNTEFLNDSRKMKEKLSTIDKNHYREQIDFGSVIETSKNYYFISVPIGKINMSDGSTVYAISTEAPVFEVMKGKKAGDSFTFNNETFKIEAVG